MQIQLSLIINSVHSRKCKYFWLQGEKAEIGQAESTAGPGELVQASRLGWQARICSQEPDQIV